MGNCLKRLVSLWYLIFALPGLAAFLIGIALQIKYSHYSKFVGNNIWTLPIVLIFCGIVLMLIAVVGSCGAIKESSCTIIICVILIVIILFLEIGVGIAAFCNRSTLKNIMEKEFNSTMEVYLERKDISDAWSLIQTESSCCGIYGPADWEKVFNNSTLPSSCCAEINLDEANECTVKHAHPEGCFNKIFILIDNNTLSLAIAAVIIFFIQISGIYCNYCLIRSLRNRQFETV